MFLERWLQPLCKWTIIRPCWYGWFSHQHRT